MKKYISAMAICLLPATVIADEFYLFPELNRAVEPSKVLTKKVHPDKCVKARQNGITMTSKVPNYFYYYYDEKLYSYDFTRDSKTLGWVISCSEFPRPIEMSQEQYDIWRE